MSLSRSRFSAFELLLKDFSQEHHSKIRLYCMFNMDLAVMKSPGSH
jgi:hypothetical protein